MPEGISQRFWTSMVNYNSPIPEGPFDIVFTISTKDYWAYHISPKYTGYITQVEMQGVRIPPGFQRSKKLEKEGKRMTIFPDQQFERFGFVVFRFYFEPGLWKFEVPSMQQTTEIKVEKSGSLPMPLADRRGIFP
ncbi:hypothetical protein MN608_10233 [Microdochium nivale]|nr:hypothetical protein MN608_10233 [Microdochium nivale]